MRHKPSSIILGIACAALIAVAAAACNRGDMTSRTDRDKAGPAGTTAANTAPGTPVTMTGCLQKSDGLTTTYILTTVNSQAPVGTSGSPSAEREQQQAAAKSYRLSGDDDNFKNLVGKQVRVTGTMAEKSNLPAGSDPSAAKGTAGSAADRDRDRDRTKIDEGDLARISVTTIESIGDACK